MLTLLRQGRKITVSGEYTLAEGALAHQTIEGHVRRCRCACPLQTASPDDRLHRDGAGGLFLSAHLRYPVARQLEVLLGAMAARGSGA